MSERPRVLGVVVCDLERTAVGTRSRLGGQWDGTRTVIETVVDRLLRVEGVGDIVVLAPEDQLARVNELLTALPRVRVKALIPRPASIAARVRAGRAWNLQSWRGGAGQWTFFDEEYPPAGAAAALAAANQDMGDPAAAYEHVLHVHSHGVFLDVAMTSALVHHHLHKNHEMRVTYTPAAPGLSGMVLRADIVKEMGEKNVLPGQLLGYDVKSPTFDTLIREACMQVDPALSKIPNRFCVDTCRSEAVCRTLAERAFGSTAEMCLAAARGVAPGMSNLSLAHDWPREIEIELSARRLTHPPGGVPGNLRERATLDAEHWVSWLTRHGDLRGRCDDLLITVGGDGDPLLAPKEVFLAVLRAARHAGALSICVQTDLAGGDVDGLLAAAGQGLIDVVTVTMYGHTAATYAKVAGVDLHSNVLKHLERLAEAARAASMPLVVPRLLKVRETIPELEPFFDFWVERAGWGVIDYPTDRAGAVPFAGVVDMGPPKRRACRRIWDRMAVRCDGRAVACDQDVHAKLAAGHVESDTIDAMWRKMNDLRATHAAGRWNDISPCNACREWHRA